MLILSIHHKTVLFSSINNQIFRSSIIIKKSESQTFVKNETLVNVLYQIITKRLIHRKFSETILSYFVLNWVLSVKVKNNIVAKVSTAATFQAERQLLHWPFKYAYAALKSITCWGPVGTLAVAKELKTILMWQANKSLQPNRMHRLAFFVFLVCLVVFTIL